MEEKSNGIIILQKSDGTDVAKPSCEETRKSESRV